MTGHTPDRLLVTVRDAAAMLSISERTLWSLTASGEIPRLKIGAAVRYDVADLRRWIDEKKEGCGQ